MIIGTIATAGAACSAAGPIATQLLDGGGCGATIDAVRARALSPSPGPACPATYDDAHDRGGCGGFRDRVGPCGGALVYAGSCGLDNFACAYDVDSRLLVGAATSTDTNAFCDMRSSCLEGGVLPAEIICGVDRLDVSACNLGPLTVDSGTDGAPPDVVPGDGG